MIKKCLLGLGISVLGLLSFTNAWDIEKHFNIPDTLVINNSAVLVFDNLNFSSTYTNISMENVFYTPMNKSSNGRNQNFYFLAWYDKKPYLYGEYVFDGNRNSVYQGFPQKFCMVNAGSGSSCYSNGIYKFNTDISVFINANGFVGGTFYGNNSTSSYNPSLYCFTDNTNDYCLMVCPYSSNCGGSQLSGSLGVVSSLPNDINRITWGKSPFYSKNNDYQPGNTEVIPTDLDRYIEYYETRWGRNRDMCYVGTNDFTSPYGSGLSFEVGTGLFIYELYYKYYGTFGSNKVKNVGSFVNTLLINYSQWFYDGQKYLVTYNGPDTNISVNYENLSFPFANKPVASFFLASNIFDNYSTESTQGEEIVYYCDLKLNQAFYRENEEDFQEVVDLVGSNVTDRVKTYYNTQISVGSGSIGFSVPDLSGSVWGDISSGNVLPDDLSPTNLFKDFFTKITNLTKSFTPNSNPLLPDWIVYPLIFLVLFRIFKH